MDKSQIEILRQQAQQAGIAIADTLNSFEIGKSGRAACGVCTFCEVTQDILTQLFSDSMRDRIAELSNSHPINSEAFDPVAETNTEHSFMRLKDIN